MEFGVYGGYGDQIFESHEWEIKDLDGIDTTTILCGLVMLLSHAHSSTL